MRTTLCLIIVALLAISSVTEGAKHLAKENKNKGRAPGDPGDEIDTSSKGKDKAVTQGDLTVDVKGQSGKFSVTRNNLGKAKKKSSVTVNIDSITEVDSKGNTVGQKGKVKHSVNSLARQDFTFTVAKENVLAGANATAKATRVTFNTSLDTGSNLVVETLLVSSKGTVGTDTEAWTVLPGDMKFNLALSKWVFATDGAFVDIELEIKGSKKEPKQREKGKKIHADKNKKGKKLRFLESHTKKEKKNKGFDLGDGAVLELSDKILIDGVWASMPEGYPKFELKGSKQSYTFRFPKFTDTAFYDPIVGFSSTDADAEEAENNESSDGASLSLSGMLLFSLTSIVTALFF